MLIQFSSSKTINCKVIYTQYHTQQRHIFVFCIRKDSLIWSKDINAFMCTFICFLLRKILLRKIQHSFTPNTLLILLFFIHSQYTKLKENNSYNKRKNRMRVPYPESKVN